MRYVAAIAALVIIVAVGGARASGEAVRVPAFKRVIVVVFENKSYDGVIGDRSAPTFNRMARRYALLTRYFAVAHPSLPNYLALVSGSTHGVTDDCTDCTFASRSLADTIEASGRTWKTYAEGLPARGFTGSESGRYSKKHNPFLYFKSVLAKPKSLRQIVPFAEFSSDLSRRRLPDFSLVVPDLCNSMHDCSMEHGDAWLAAFLKPLFGKPQLADSVVFVLFDEAEKPDVAGGGGHIVCLALGPLVRPGARSTATRNHYSVLRTIEDAWGLPHLGNSAAAVPITGVWRG